MCLGMESRPHYELYSRDELLEVVEDFETRFQTIRGLLYYEYGRISSDDLLGFIDRLVPKYIQPRKISPEEKVDMSPI